MRKATAAHVGVIIVFILTMWVFYSCSSPNTTATTVSSTSARIVTCPTTTVTAVDITNFLFQPSSVSIAVNDIVMWTNNDSMAHTVTSGTPGEFDSGNIAPNHTVCVQFLEAGAYPYFCTIHTFMTGTVAVQ